MKTTNKTILEDILHTCKEEFQMIVKEVIPINRGWLNLKWKLSTESGDLLIKQYNKERFKKYKREDLLFAFAQQLRLKEHGLPCPMIYKRGGRMLFETEYGELFVMMEFCPGKLVSPGGLNVQQMYDLGKTTGKMHRILNDESSGMKDRPEFIPQSREKRLNHWQYMWEESNKKGKMELLPIIEAQIVLTDSMNLENLNLSETGWAHRDLFMDNLLFHKDSVSAVLDFDRLKYDYPQLDVARAVISGALLDNHLNLVLVHSFMEGYQEERCVERGFLTKALGLLWYMESAWWIEPEMNQHIGPPVRFAEEMVWLTENYKILPELLE